VSALEQWHAEISDGKRTASAPLDTLWRAACREVADAEFERDVLAPQRAYLETLRTPPAKPESESRAQWAVVMAWDDDEDDAS
jgi:hypothetical protein